MICSCLSMGAVVGRYVLAVMVGTENKFFPIILKCVRRARYESLLWSELLFRSYTSRTINKLLVKCKTKCETTYT